MAAVSKVSQFSKGVLGTVCSPSAGIVVVNDFFIDLVAGDLVTDKMFDLGILPNGHDLLDAVLISDDLDTDGTPAVTLDVGLLTGTVGDATSDRAMGDEIFAASTVGQAGTAARATAKGAFLVKASDADRSIGLKVKLQPDVAAAGRVRLRTYMAAASYRLTF